MNLTKVIDETINNGGCSYNVTTGDSNPTYGYMVAIHGAEVSMPMQDLNDQTLANYINFNAVALADPAAFLGTWHDQKTNSIYLDVSYLIEDKDEAIMMAKLNRQLAIYDNKNKVSIYL